jgi:hypothetical protein
MKWRMVILSPLGCTQHKNEASIWGLFSASFGGISLVHGLFKPSFFAVKITYIMEPEMLGFQHSVLTGSCMS